jgi:cytochrome c biogenesis protein CcmG/thiol:disulfide interchange protein DsbE
VHARALNVLRAMLIVALPLAPTPATPAIDAGFNLDRYHGRVVVVDFWASWCKPCRQSMPWLNELSSRYGGRGLVVVGVNVDAERGDAEKFLRDVPVSFEVVFDPAGSLAKSFKVPGMPATFVFDRDGALADQHLGFKQAQKAPFEARLQELLAHSAPQ